MIKISDEQIYTLRRMKSGTQYQMRGDTSRGRECRTAYIMRGKTAVGVPDDITCRSLRPLMSKGLIEFVHSRFERTGTQYYAVQLTDAGREASQLKTSKEQNHE